MNGDMLTSKNICEDLDLAIFKSLSCMVLEFHAHNTSSFAFTLQLSFSGLVNLDCSVRNPEYTVEVPPDSTFKICEFPILGSFTYKYKFVYQKLSPEPQVKTEVITDNLILKITQKDMLRQVTFDLFNKRPELITFELQFEEMVNIRDPNQGKTHFSVNALPRSVTPVCELVFDPEWKYSYTFSHVIVPETIDLGSLQVSIIKKVADSRQNFYRIPIDIVALSYLTQILESNKFTDPYFPPSNISISSSFDEDVQVHWRRPEEFVSGELTLYPPNIKRTKIVEGKVKASWMKCALCSLLTHGVVQNLIENAEVSREGIYRVYLFKNGEKTWVSIDDFIACYPGGGPMYTHSADSELWVMLLEKALAKLLGSYERLNYYSGLSGLIDLTGCPAYVYPSDSLSNFWSSFKEWHDAGYLVIVQYNEDYFVLNKSEIVYGHKLFRVKSPWMDPQQLLQLSTGWTKNVQESFKATYDENDASFWVDIEGLKATFEYVILSKMKDFNEDRIRTIISRTPEGGFARDCLQIELSSTVDLIIGIHQEDLLNIGADEYRRPLDLGVAILSVNGSSCSLHACLHATSIQREVFIEGTLPPGQYFVVPLSSAVSLQRGSADPVYMPLLTAHATLSPAFKFTLQDLFNRLCKSNSYELSFEDFEYINSRLDLKLTAETYSSKILNKHASTNGLAFQGLMEYFADEIEFRGEATVREWMCRLGYDEHMYSIESRPIVISCQSECTFLTSEHELNPHFARLALEEFIDCNAVVEAQESRFVIKALRHTQGCSFLVENKSLETLHLQFDFSLSENALFSNGSHCAVEVRPLSRAIIQQVGARNSNEAFTAVYTFNEGVNGV